MTIRDILISHLKQNGFDGLVNPDVPCGCSLEDFMPCDCCLDDCEPGYLHHDHRPGKTGWGMFTKQEKPTDEEFAALEEA